MATRRPGETPPPPRGPQKLKALPRPAADAAAPVTYALALAVRALKNGSANDHQQKMVLEWIVADAAGKRHFPKYPDTHDTMFALGRLFVAEQIVGLLHVDMATLRRADDDVA